MPDKPMEATATLPFDRPMADVKALFFDADLVVRQKVHRGVRLQWLPRTPDGERRLRRHTRIMDRMHVEDVVIEPGPDDTWVLRYVEGPSAGTRFVASFEASGEGTLVMMRAKVGPKGFEQGLGRLSPVGLEKAMKRILNEYKVALQGYEPGRARGAVTAVLHDADPSLAKMRGVDPATLRKLVATLLETSLSIACADDDPDEAELDAVRAIVGRLWGKPLAPELEEQMVRAASQAVKKQGAAERATALGTRLAELGFAQLGVELAVLVAEVSRGLDPAELHALRALAHAGGVSDDELQKILRRTEENLSGGDPFARMSTFG
jgi:tellurite resistance protein